MCFFFFSLSLLFFFFWRRTSGFFPPFSLRCFQLKRKCSIVKHSLKDSISKWFFTSSEASLVTRTQLVWGYFLMHSFSWAKRLILALQSKEIQ